MNDPLDQLRLRFTGLRLVSDTGQGQVYAGQDFSGAEVTVAVLSPQAAADAGARQAFADVVWRYSTGGAPSAQSAVYAADLHAARPWAAVRNPAGQPGAEQLLGALGGGGVTPGAGGVGTAPAGTPPPPTVLAEQPPTAPAEPPPTVLAGPPPPADTPPPPTMLAGPPPGVAPGSPAAMPASPGAPYPGYPPQQQYPGQQPYQGQAPYPGQQPYQGQPQYPGQPGAPPPGQGKSGSPWPLLIGVAASVLVLLTVVGVVIVAVQLGGDDDEESPIAGPTLGPVPTVGPTVGPQPTTEPSPGGGTDGGKPELRDVDPISLIGPTWERSDDTFTMAFTGWPFAFRTPGHWNCLRGELSIIPDAEIWGCTGGTSGQRVNVMLWECPTTCTEDEQEDMIDQWLDDPEDAQRRSDPTIAYVEYEENVNGNYGIDMSLFAGDPADPGGPLRWHIGAYAEAPQGDLDDSLRTLNDIISQATA